MSHELTSCDLRPFLPATYDVFVNPVPTCHCEEPKATWQSHLIGPSSSCMPISSSCLRLATCFPTSHQPPATSEIGYRRFLSCDLRPATCDP
jgi:hypothetical protein